MTQEVRKGLSLFRGAFFREKYRFDQGNAFLVFVNFALLVASLVKQSGTGDSGMIRAYIIAGLVGTWFLGYFLDRVVRVQDAQEKIALHRSPIWQENFRRQEHLQGEVRELHQKIDRLEAVLSNR